MALPELSLGAVLQDEVPPALLRASPRFDEYLTGGLYPFVLEAGPAQDLFGNIVETVIRSDLPAYEPRLSVGDLEHIERMLAFVGRSPIDGVNYTSIGRNLGITKYMAERYVRALERAFLLRQAFPAGTNVLREPKVFLEPPYRLLYRPWDECIGALREDFFALAMAQHGAPFRYAKSTRGAKTPDFLVTLDGRDYVIEVGGRGKGRTQFKGLDYDTQGRPVPRGRSAIPVRAALSPFTASASRDGESVGDHLHLSSGSRCSVLTRSIASELRGRERRRGMIEPAEKLGSRDRVLRNRLGLGRHARSV